MYGFMGQAIRQSVGARTAGLENGAQLSLDAAHLGAPPVLDQPEMHLGFCGRIFPTDIEGCCFELPLQQHPVDGAL